jgi:hypothetical protein
LDYRRIVFCYHLPNFLDTPHIYDISRLRVKHRNKGEAIPLQPLTGPEGSSRLRLPDFKTVGG